MAYECSSCAISHGTKKELVQHMLEKHNCVFTEGEYAAVSKKLVLALPDNDRKKQLLEKFDE